MKRRVLAQVHLWERLKADHGLDPAAQSGIRGGAEAVYTAVDALLTTRPTIATIEAVNDLVEALGRLEVRS